LISSAITIGYDMILFAWCCNHFPDTVYLLLPITVSGLESTGYLVVHDLDLCSQDMEIGMTKMELHGISEEWSYPVIDTGTNDKYGCLFCYRLTE
jgi:hypothetical protein